VRKSRDWRVSLDDLYHLEHVANRGNPRGNRLDSDFSRFPAPRGILHMRELLFMLETTHVLYRRGAARVTNWHDTGYTRARTPAGKENIKAHPLIEWRTRVDERMPQTRNPDSAFRARRANGGTSFAIPLQFFRMYRWDNGQTSFLSAVGGVCESVGQFLLPFAFHYDVATRR